MLGKLLKYEFKSTARVFLPFYAATLLVSIISRLLGGSLGFLNYNTAYNTAHVISTVVAALLIGAVCVIAILLAVQRFHRNLIGDEGYLMFTLPVKLDWLILSKLITAVVWFTASVVVGTASIVLMTRVTGRQFLNGINAFFSSFTEAGTALLFIEGLFTLLFLLAGGILTVYAAMALSMLANRRRGLLAFGFWIGFAIVAQIIANAWLGTLLSLDYSVWINTMSLGWRQQLLVAASMLLSLASCAVMYFITRTMLKRKLNLE